MLSACRWETHPWESHGCLRVSADGHFLEHEDDTGFFWLGDTAWRLARLKREEITRYLENRVRKGFNVIQFNVRGMADLDSAADKPFHGSGPPWPDVRPNERYWRHIDWIVDEIERVGMYAALICLWGPEVDNPSSRQEQMFNDPDECNLQYGRFLGDRYKDTPHVIWVVSGEYHLPYYFPPVAQEHLSRLDRLAQGIGEGDAGGHLRTIHPLSRYSSSQEFHDVGWLDFNMVQTHVYHDLIDSLVSADWERAPAKPTINAEGWYEAEEELFERKEGIVKVRPFDRSQSRYDTAWIQRYQAYWSTFFGAIGYTYGHMNLWTMSDLYELYTVAPGTRSATLISSALDAPGSATLKYLRLLIESRPSQRRVPDQSLIAPNTRGSDGTISPDLRCATRDVDGRWAMVYSTKGLVIRVVISKLAAGRAAAFWYNPSNGRWHVGGQELEEKAPAEEGIPSGAGAPDQHFYPPGATVGPGGGETFWHTGGVGEGNDWVLLLEID